MTTTKRSPSILPFQISPTLARHPCGTPEKQFNTPSKSRLTTGRTSSATPGNRYIPNRLAGDLEFSRYQVAITPKNNPLGNTSNTSSHGDSSSGRDHASSVMINQLLALKGQKPNSRVLSFQQTPKQQTKDHEYWRRYADFRSQSSSPKSSRKTPKSANKVLDAPKLIDDFYLNVLDWSRQNVLGVALGGAVYMFNASKEETLQLCDVEADSLYITSLQWDKSGKHLAVATSNAEIQVWDVNAGKCVRRMKSHHSRVSSLSWHPKTSLLSTGARSGHIHNYDPRSSHFHVHNLQAHKLDVCGLQWSESGRFLASGGNDNLVKVWDTYQQDSWTTPCHTFTAHTAAVKALAWCPWQPSVLASAGGSADKSMRLWNVCSGGSEGHVYTDSQISGLVWSSSHKELLSCHGNPSNALRLWKWQPNSCSINDSNRLSGSGLRQLAELTGHEGRILHVASSPDGQSVATAAADETLRFWRCFETSKKFQVQKESSGSPLSGIGISSFIR